MEPQNNDQELLKKAKRRVKEIRGFYSHLFTFVIVNSFLAAVNLITTPNNIWFYWVIFGWGIGLVSHALNTFGFAGMLNDDWEQRKVKEYVEKHKENN